MLTAEMTLSGFSIFFFIPCTIFVIFYFNKTASITDFIGNKELQQILEVFGCSRGSLIGIAGIFFPHKNNILILFVPNFIYHGHEKSLPLQCFFNLCSHILPKGSAQYL